MKKHNIQKLHMNGIDISVEKKKIKHMYLRVLPPNGAVQISAPVRASDRAISGFAAAHMKWIENKRQKFCSAAPCAAPEYATGEEHILWGRRYTLKVEPTNGNPNVSIQGQTIVLQTKGDSTTEQRKAILSAWQRHILKEAALPLLREYEARIGVKANEWNVKNMRTKWGSCNVQAKRIWLSLQLVQKPPDCLAYVITHELVHLLERSHNEVFKGYMDQFYPSWREVKAQLNDWT